MTWLDKPTFPRLGRSTLNELQQNQDEKASLVCVRVQSPSGLALVPCAFEYDRRKWPITMLNHTEKHPWYRKVIVFFFFFWHPTLVRCAISPGAVSPAVSPAVSRWCCRCSTALDRTSALLLSTTIAMSRSIRDISAVFRLLCACCMTLVVVWCCGIPRCFVF